MYPKLKILPTTLDKSTFSFILNNSFSSNDRSYFMANVENDPKLKEQFLKYYKDNKDKIDSSMETSTSMAPFYFKANEPDLVTNQDDINVFNNWLDVLDETSKTW
ncbi:hypothetical protein GW750_06365 [bacterium]|nr:hypothetical protein [bacterium]